MSTKTDIANQAFGHIGISKTIANVDVPGTNVEGLQFNKYYDDAVKRMFEVYKPKFAQKWANLALVEEQPNSEWAFSFRYPTDCLMVLGITPTRIGEVTFDEVRYTLSSDATGKLLFTDFGEIVELNYVQDFTSTNDMPASVRLGLSYEMAALIAPSVSKKAPINSLALAEKFMKQAMTSQKGQEGQGAWPESSAVRIRGG